MFHLSTNLSISFGQSSLFLKSFGDVLILKEIKAKKNHLKLEEKFIDIKGFVNYHHQTL